MYARLAGHSIRTFGPPAGRLAICLAVATTGVALAAPPVCAPIDLDRRDLERILDEGLRDYGSAVISRRVTIGPESACYVHIALTVDILGAARCDLTACSTPVHEGQAIGLAPFNVQGCDPAYELLGAPRLVPAMFGDASASIEGHCGQRGWLISRIAPVGAGSARRVRVELRYSPTPQAPVAR